MELVVIETREEKRQKIGYSDVGNSGLVEAARWLLGWSFFLSFLLRRNTFLLYSAGAKNVNHEFLKISCSVPLSLSLSLSLEREAREAQSGANTFIRKSELRHPSVALDVIQTKEGPFTR